MKTHPSKRVSFVPVPTEEREGAEEGDDLVQAGDQRPRNKFTVWNEIVIWCSLLFYVGDLCLDLWTCSVHFNTKKPRSAWFIFFAILLPNLYAGYKSLQWYLRAHALTPLRKPHIWMIRVFFFPISPILRYLDAWWYGFRARQAWKKHNYGQEKKFFEGFLVESAEVAMLRLVIIFLEDAPIVVLNLAILIEAPPGEWAMAPGIKEDPEAVRLGLVIAKLACTMTLGVVHYMSCNKLAWHLAHSREEDGHGTHTPSSTAPAWERKGILSWVAEVTIYCWQLLSIGSRVTAYALFAVVRFNLLWVPIIVRWLIHTLWIYFDVREMSVINSVAFGGVYLFSFVTTSPGHQILRILLYYVITFGENIIIAILWSYYAPDNYFQACGLAVMFGGAIGGLIFLMIYYCWCHPDRQNIWAWQKFRELQEKRQNRPGIV
ncbi:XK-related protein 4-like isoform X1 [Macrobrachium rosenbergii]|uniref:XK-related protein 4-like isoform X1 n=1 Tax=Macrobrachium rosenbergii TaxID=79674 RepID=UPI0034D667B4